MNLSFGQGVGWLDGYVLNNSTLRSLHSTLGQNRRTVGFVGVDDESIPTDIENRWDGQPRDSDGRFDKGSKSGKKFRISRKEKSSESPKKSDKGVEKSAESGIINSNSTVSFKSEAQARAYIKSDEQSKKIFMGSQKKHMQGTKEYIDYVEKLKKQENMDRQE